MDGSTWCSQLDAVLVVAEEENALVGVEDDGAGGFPQGRGGGRHPVQCCRPGWPDARRVQVAGLERGEGMGGCLDEGLAVVIAGVQDEREAGELVEVLDQYSVGGCGGGVDGLDTGGAVDVHDSGDLVGVVGSDEAGPTA
ncbi:hypothetical protein N4G69_47905 [Streptomyces mirabilis]|nr:hypothetical protein [Streptomyces mirabilis]MCT9113168.1 hypothetical protein [Streptomyces mirabilis]